MCQWNAEPNPWPPGLDLLGLERQFRRDVIDEHDRCPLVAQGVGAQNPETSAVVDGGSLRPEVVLPQPEDLLDHLRVGLRRPMP